ncbi:DUF5134 domain-containing protein [Micromonospora sp. WMMD975]|uniref:DUF5134 domain-containing protein n=1 Tax=Micromonospora sp. WMMD975 TaxID=3016087 RepID=UPI002499C08F|nr:DUF5134 domain-containing protein [Micromonospora sp. WMMD975]WFE30927.1 DUF5134 domain-containing protein [Micromonospora sp. WMMD975]
MLTAVFLATGLVCAAGLLIRRRGSAGDRELTDVDLVDISHGVMSAAMILMLWVLVEGVVAWAQVAIFAILALSLLPAYRRARATSGRVDLLGHMAMGVAMMWMLAAMPTLMSEMAAGGTGSGHSHGGGNAAAGPTATPMWADVVNVAFVVLAAGTALWWLYRAATVAGHRLHLASYAAMAGGMATMLVLMNG